MNRRTRFQSYSTARAAAKRWFATGCASYGRADRNVIGQDLMRVQYRWPVGMPLCRALGEGLWEVRSSLPGNKTARVLFSVHQGRIVALHGFIKKSQKTPDEDLALARRRKREFED